MFDEGCCEDQTVLLTGWVHFFALPFRSWLVLCVALPVCLPVFAVGYRPTFAGVVDYVADGDTLHVIPAQGGQPVKVRIHGIDAPEICQSGGASSRAALARRVKGQQVVVHAKSYDQYGRTIARVTLGGEDIGEWMVKQGNAWAYYYRVGYGPYTAYQRQAQAAHRGVFASGDPMAPSLFRKQHGSCH